MILASDLKQPGYARLALISGLALVFLGATYLWATRGAAIVLDMSWTGCL